MKLFNIIAAIVFISFLSCKKEETDPCKGVNFTITTLTSVPTGVGTADGTITITAPVGAYVYKLGNADWSSVRTYSNLAAGTYIISVKGADDCILTKSVTLQ